MDQEISNTSPYNINRLVLKVEKKRFYFKVRPPFALSYLLKYKPLTQIYCSYFTAKYFVPKGYHPANTSCASLAPITARAESRLQTTSWETVSITL